MTFSDTLQVEGIRSVENVTWHGFTHLQTGLTVRGELEILPPIDPRLQLGSDTRETAWLHIIRDDYAEFLAEVAQEDRLQQASESSRPTWMIARRDDNPGDPVVKFFLAKLGSADA